MYIPSLNETDLTQQEASRDVIGIDLDEVLGDIDACMQSPECTDHSNPPVDR